MDIQKTNFHGFEVSEPSYYRLLREYGDMEVSQAQPAVGNEELQYNDGHQETAPVGARRA